MGMLNNLFGKLKSGSQSDRPFMEHPTGENESALEAMQEAMRQLDSIDMQGRWITFSGQGQGYSPDSYHVVDIDYSDSQFNVGKISIDLDRLLESIGLKSDGRNIFISADGILHMNKVDAHNRALFLDALFKELGVKPFDENDDYAVGAEWLSAA